MDRHWLREAGLPRHEDLWHSTNADTGEYLHSVVPKLESGGRPMTVLHTSGTCEIMEETNRFDAITKDERSPQVYEDPRATE